MTLFFTYDLMVTLKWPSRGQIPKLSYLDDIFFKSIDLKSRLQIWSYFWPMTSWWPWIGLLRSNFKVVWFGRSFFNWSIWRVDFKYDFNFDLWPHGDLKMTLKRSNFTNDSVLRKEKVIKLWHQNGCYFQNGGHLNPWRRYVRSPSATSS